MLEQDPTAENLVQGYFPEQSLVHRLVELLARETNAAGRISLRVSVNE